MQPQLIFDNGAALQAILMGIIAPLLTAFFSKCSWSAATKGGICFLIAVLFATLQNAANFKLEDWASSISLVVVSAQSFYGMLWKPLGLTSALQSVGPVSDKAEG